MNLYMISFHFNGSGMIYQEQIFAKDASDAKNKFTIKHAGKSIVICRIQENLLNNVNVIKL
jgi:hypothetical protein